MDRDITRLEGQIAGLVTDVRGIMQEISEIKTLVREHPVLCPYRESIASVALNARDIAALQAKVRDLELAVARSGAIGGLAGGGVVSLIVTVVFGIGKMAGWW